MNLSLNRVGLDPTAQSRPTPHCTRPRLSARESGGVVAGGGALRRRYRCKSGAAREFDAVMR
jgi:hypothetical protein